ncbi:hypothetical protein IWW55_001941 [Coemansia sp. RSA 2706]|nr:hypothetical protein IWW55_001941 [Coemansia sp. RSA 2706]KAJ2314169.1 hypothetical protein IWW54_001074 [Coemansia sp. RSA 2705]KAJ2317567.1 hypothetical protein IWW52_003053 [Coemansia sp. RSA 2704]KAJ2329319.1 hypothetical protein IWW51_000672 [Coemansia sp. RSA 2702]KAJ2370346.1 hypothetical protein H4S01_000440 [Coemansia sp. RSA 2610]KAJ2373521.1 hypothetical protein H4S02_008827 [Coemansia sp. RSA 2611]KAJ2732175.1 hypothetical protein H4R23_002900 [Coemansia sp. Cherry 401B]
MLSNNISGTGTGTPHPAATDTAKESGTTVFGGVELVDNPANPAYIGHGVAHRDPKTGVPVDAHVHIPTRGELNPEEFAITKVAEASEFTDKERLQSKYSISNPGKYHANWYKAKSALNGMLGKVTGSQKYLEKAARQGDLATLELSAYNEENGGYTFAKV